MFQFADRADAPLLGDDVPKFTVEFHSQRGPAQRLEQPLDGPLVVSDALKKTNAARRFKRMDIFVIRKGADGRGIKMQVDYDRRARNPVAQHDYAIHPGDRIIVVDDPSTVIDDMAGSILGPLKQALH
jgi:hypothetical protein